MQENTLRRLSTGELIRRLMNNVSGIIDREVALAREEARGDVKQMAVASGMLIAGGLFLYTALVALVTTVVIALAPTLAPWVIAAIVFGFFLIIGAILARSGHIRVKMQPMARTRQSLKEDVEWARSQTISREK